MNRIRIIGDTLWDVGLAGLWMTSCLWFEDPWIGLIGAIALISVRVKINACG